MKTYKYLVAGLLLAGFGGAARAAVGPNDLVIGFAAASGTGSATNLEVDLGSVGSYVTATAGVYTIGDLSSSLNSIYGASGAWASNSALTWAVVGATDPTGATGGPNGQNPLSLWASSLGTTSPAPAWQHKSGSIQQTATSNIGGVYNSFGVPAAVAQGGINSQTSAFGATLTGISIGTSDAASWTAQGGNAQGNAAFGLATLGTAHTVQIQNAVTSGLNSDLYQMNAGTPTGNGTDLGFFTLGSNGVLTFTVAGSPIPEPSTYAAILGAATLGLIMLRRRNQSVVTE